MRRLCVEYVEPDEIVYELARTIRDPVKAYYFVRDRIEYKSDPLDHWQTPRETLESMRGDCEDKAILLASILIAFGYDAWIRIADINISSIAKHHRSGRIHHAWVILRNGVEWIELDPSCINCDFGQTAFTVNKLIMDFNTSIIRIHDPEEAVHYIIK